MASVKRSPGKKLAQPGLSLRLVRDIRQERATSNPVAQVIRNCSWPISIIIFLFTAHSLFSAPGAGLSGAFVFLRPQF